MPITPGIPTPAAPAAPTTPLVEHLSLLLANTWYSITLTNVSICKITMRAPAGTQIWEVELPGNALTITRSETQMYYFTGVLFTGTIRIRTNVGTQQVAQIETWR